jgi:5-methylcytosine-specific restriction endonuclease McrA
LKRRTELRRGSGIAAVSRKRRAQLRTRADVRRIVIARDGGCRGRFLIPEQPCGFLPGRAMLEVDEIIPRGRGGDWLNPDHCQLLCPRCHDWKHAHPREATERGLTARLPPKPD